MKIALPQNNSDNVTVIRTIGEEGFTLLEMLVVLAIIGLMVGLVGPRILGSLADSKLKTAQIQIDNIASAVDMFYLDAGRYPSATEGLTALVQRPADLSSWNGPYLKAASVPSDPWGHPFLYQAPGADNASFEITSTGPDGKSVVRGVRATLEARTQ